VPKFLPRTHAQMLRNCSDAMRLATAMGEEASLLLYCAVSDQDPELKKRASVLMDSTATLVAEVADKLQEIGP
jgi:hypothetical protein